MNLDNNDTSKNHGVTQFFNTQDLITLWEKYELSHPESMNLLKICWVSPFSSKMMINPYNWKNDNEDYSNIWRHCIAVAYASEKIVKYLSQNWLIQENDITNIVHNSIVHDWNKRFEIMRKKAQKEWVQLDVYWVEWYNSMSKILQNNWIVQSDLQNIEKMWNMTWHNSLIDFISIVNWKLILNPNRTLNDFIIHLSDDMTSSTFIDNEERTYYLSFEKRAELSHFNEKYPFLWKEWFWINEKWIVLYSDINEKEAIEWEIKYSYFEWQKIIFDMISKYLKDLVQPNTIENNIDFILKIVHHDEILIEMEKIKDKIRDNLQKD